MYPAILCFPVLSQLSYEFSCNLMKYCNFCNLVKYCNFFAISWNIVTFCNLVKYCNFCNLVKSTAPYKISCMIYRGGLKKVTRIAVVKYHIKLFYAIYMNLYELVQYHLINITSTLTSLPITSPAHLLTMSF